MPAIMTYNAVGNFPVATADGQDMTYYGIWTAEAGGNFLGGKVLSNDPAALVTGQRWQFAAGQIVITMPDGDGTPAFAEFLLQLAATQTLWLSAHSDDPGSTGANEMAGNGYGRIALTPASWVVVQV